MLKKIVPLAGLVVAITGCFRPDTACHLRCDVTEPFCPPDYRCVLHGGLHVCARSDDQTCADPSDGAAEAVPDAAGELHSPDAPIDASDADADAGTEAGADADAGADAEAGADADAKDADDLLKEVGPDVGDTNPSCKSHQICGRGSCFFLSGSIENGLVLLLDPSNLPAPDSDVMVWRDRSCFGNDAKEEDPDYTPQSTTNGVRFVATGQGFGAGFEVASAISLELGTDDFLVELVADMPQVGADTQAEPTSFINQRDAFMLSKQMAIDWEYVDLLSHNPTVQGQVNDAVIAPGITLPQGPALLSLSRTGLTVELRINGQSVGQATLDANQNATNDRPIILGSEGDLTTPIEGLHIAIIARGSVDPQEVRDLEQALLRAFPN